MELSLLRMGDLSFDSDLTVDEELSMISSNTGNVFKDGFTAGFCWGVVSGVTGGDDKKQPGLGRGPVPGEPSIRCCLVGKLGESWKPETMSKDWTLCLGEFCHGLSK